MTPKQRMQINGVYLENVVTGYQTLEVTGREPIDVDVSTIKLTTVDGERYKRKRLNSREIEVRFMIRRDTPAEFLASYNTLNYALTQTEAQLIFDDEPDLYWTGTPVELNVDYPGQSVSEGTITIKCSDPYKYTINEVEATVTDDAATFEYGGTHPAYPIFEITANSNLGFIGIADEAGHVIQIGDPLDPDQEEALPDTESTVTVSTQPPTSWTQNAFTPTIGTTKTVTGSVATATVSGKRYAKPSYGSTSISGWHGPTLSYEVGGNGALKITQSWQMLWYDSSSKKNTIGEFVAEMQNAQGQNIAAVTFWHSKKGDANSWFELTVNGKSMKKVSFKATANNTYTGTKGGSCSIERFGENITFRIGPKVYTFTDTSLAAVEGSYTNYTKKCGFFFAQSTAQTPLSQNLLYKASLIVHQVDSHEAIPNKIQEGDVISVDVGSGTIYLNGVPADGLGALGNDYETFTLEPGENTVGFACSEWASADPTYKVLYREVFV